MEKFQVLSVQKGPLEGGGSYSSMWVQPLTWEDRSAPHLTRGPVPFKVDCDVSVVDQLALESLPAVISLDMGMKVGAGNKAKAYVYKAETVKAVSSVPVAKVS